MAIVKTSEKSAVATLLLCMFLGNLGVHRFYVGKWVTGILMLLTFGGLGIWYLVDIALIVCNRFTDCRGRVVELAKNPASFRTIMSIFTVFIVAFYGLIIGSIAMAIMAATVLIGVAQEQLNAFRTGDMNSAYSYTSSDFQKKTSLEKFSSFAHQYRLESNESAYFYNGNVDSNNGYVAGKLKLKDGTVYTIQYHLHKDGDQWKIISIGIGVQDAAKPNLPTSGNSGKK